MCLFGIGHFTRVPESTDEVENAYKFLNTINTPGGGLEKKRLLVRRFRFNRVPLTAMEISELSEFVARPGLRGQIYFVRPGSD